MKSLPELVAELQRASEDAQAAMRRMNELHTAMQAALATTPASVESLVATAALCWGLESAVIRSHTRTAPVCQARWTVWSELRSMGYSYHQIADAFGQWDHSAVHYGVHQLPELIEQKPEVRSRYAAFRQAIQQNNPTQS